ncbi:MAG: hypothetical protein GY845_07965 [Planctomycetes bacterium]|nr:hypothetical protein [Planctomycetota bacterium]
MSGCPRVFDAEQVKRIEFGNKILTRPVCTSSVSVTPALSTLFVSETTIAHWDCYTATPSLGFGLADTMNMCGC